MARMGHLRFSSPGYRVPGARYLTPGTQDPVPAGRLPGGYGGMGRGAGGREAVRPVGTGIHRAWRTPMRAA